MLGISIVVRDIFTRAEDKVPTLSKIILPDNNIDRYKYIDLKQLNNGRIRLNDKLLNRPEFGVIDLNQIDYTVQSHSFIHTLLNDKKQNTHYIADDINLQRQAQIEQFVYKYVNEKIDINTAYSLYQAIDFINIWLTFKVHHITIKELQTDSEIPYTPFFEVYMNLMYNKLIIFEANPDSIGKENFDKLKGLLIQATLLFKQCVGDMYTIFTGNYIRSQSTWQHHITWVQPELITETSEALQKIRELATELDKTLRKAIDERDKSRKLENGVQ
jgi:hypothetical protein